MSAIYFDNYLRAVYKPLPALKRTFEVEFGFLKSHLHSKAKVLDVGCGIGRPTIQLAPFCKKIVGVDNDQRMLDIAKQSSAVSNIDFVLMDALRLRFPAKTFDVSYATYNLLGTVAQKDRQRLVVSMARVTKDGGKVINTTWGGKSEVTQLLRTYYPSIGIEVIEMDESKSVTSMGTFARLSKKQMRDCYATAGLKKIRFFELPPAWLAIVGTK